ncbi:MAG: hypothetical protein KAY37_04440 [Phycisphaerae bacterium]|nr:hypothetical protein [Phycisphaerae bacterium]
MPQVFTSGAKARAETIKREYEDKQKYRELVRERATRQKNENAWHAGLQNERDMAFKKQCAWLKNMENTRLERQKADNDSRGALRKTTNNPWGFYDRKTKRWPNT